MFLFKRGNIFYVEYLDTKTQKKKRISTGEKTKTGAMKYISSLSQNQKHKVQVKSIPLEQFKEEYFSYSEETFSKKYIKSIKLSFKMFEEFVSDPEINTITSQDVERFVLLIHRRSPSSANLYYRTLKAAFNKGLFWGYLRVNPFVKVKVPKQIKRLPEFLSDDEFQKLLDVHTDEVMKDLFITAYYTGLRQAELVNLKWDAINFERKELTVQNSDEFVTKSKKERIIPMNPKVLLLMKERSKKGRCEYVFPSKKNYKFHQDTVSHKFKKAVRDAGLSEKYKFHSLRKSFASNLVQRGANLYVVKDLLGHSDIQVTQIYASLNNASLVEAVNLL